MSAGGTWVPLCTPYVVDLRVLKREIRNSGTLVARVGRTIWIWVMHKITVLAWRLEGVEWMDPGLEV
jgi:hypothetical protein